MFCNSSLAYLPKTPLYIASTTSKTLKGTENPNTLLLILALNPGVIIPPAKVTPLYISLLPSPIGMLPDIMSKINNS